MRKYKRTNVIDIEEMSPVEMEEMWRCEQIDRSIAEAAWIERVILGRL